jgi:hypothetical protein
LRLQVHNLSPSSEEFRNEWSHTSAPSMSSRSVQGKFYFFILGWLKITVGMRRHVAASVVPDVLKVSVSSIFMLDLSKLEDEGFMCL